MFKRSKERKSTRLKGYDYSQNGYYFVTICVDDMEHRFGRINDGNMILNKFGNIVQQCLNNLPVNYNNCILDETIIMPNHVHCIIIIDNDRSRGRFPFDPSSNVKNGVVWKTTPTVHTTTNQLFDPKNDSTNEIENTTMNECVLNTGCVNTFSLKQGTIRCNKKHRLGEMIRSFKSNSTRQIKQTQSNTTFKWQRSFNDHIIRNEKELYYIRRYIRNNPINW